jgi:hypothetical protein
MHIIISGDSTGLLVAGLSGKVCAYLYLIAGTIIMHINLLQRSSQLRLGVVAFSKIVVLAN